MSAPGTDRPAPTDPVRRIMARQLATVHPEDALLAVAQELAADEIGAVVVETPGGPSGLISERDLVTVLAFDGDLADLQAGDIMTTDLVTASADTSIVEVGRLMRDAGVRHIVVTEGGSLFGVVSMRDVLAVLLPDED